MPKTTSDCTHGKGRAEIAEDNPWAGRELVKIENIFGKKRTKDLSYGQRGPSFKRRSDVYNRREVKGVLAWV